MGEPPLNVLRSAELKRRGIAAVEEALRAGPVHLLKRNRPAAVVLSANDYQRLQRSEAQPGIGPAPPAWSGCWSCPWRRPAEAAKPSMPTSTNNATGDRLP